MNVYGGQPMGLDWYRLLSIYSTLGSESKSHEKICDIGKELAKLDGKHDAAIKGINTKLDSLIAAGTNRLSPQDLSELKKTIVDGLARHVNQHASQCADPVVCDGESVLFTQDVKDILASLVKQKADAMRDDGLRRITENIDLIKTRLDEGILFTKADANILNKWFEHLEGQVNTLAASVATGFGDDKTDSLKAALAEAVVAKMGIGEAPSTTAFAEALGAFFDNRESLSDGDKRALAEAVVETMGRTDNTEGVTLSPRQIEDIGVAVADKVGEQRSTIPEPIIQRIIDAVDRPSGFDDSLYLMSIEQVSELFVEQDKRLTLTSGVPEAKRIDKFVRGKTAYNHNEQTLTFTTVQNLISARKQTINDDYIHRCLQNFENHVNSLRLLHTSLMVTENENNNLNIFGVLRQKVGL